MTIPADIMKTAEDLALSVTIDQSPDKEQTMAELVSTFASALLAERERCTKVAEECAIMGNLNEVNACGEYLDAWDLGVEKTQVQVAAAIRKGDTA